MYLYQIVDWYATALTFTTIGLMEIVVVSYIYGIKRFSFDMKLMLGSEPGILVKATWLVISPLMLGALLFLGLWNLEAPVYAYSNDYHYPEV